MFSHQNAAARSEFIRLFTESGHSLAASAGHYIKAARSKEAANSTIYPTRLVYPSRSLKETSAPFYEVRADAMYSPFLA